MTAQTLPAEASDDVLWSVHVNDKDYATIDMNTGLLIGLKAGVATVIAKAADGSLVGAEKEITVVDPRTEVTAAVEPSYIVVIPPSVDFGVLQKDTGTKEKPFPVEAKNLVLEQNCCIDVKVSSINSMNDGYGNLLAYMLKNSVPDVVTTGTFATFFVPRTETGSVSVDTDAISKAGAYKGTMTFNISYVKAP